MRHDIKVGAQDSLPWDTPELSAMCMRPVNENGDCGADADEIKLAAEGAIASVDETMGPIEADEEQRSAMESERMKGSNR